jgi:dihydrofolate reductase
MGETIKALTDRSSAILLGRTTYEMFEPPWSSRTPEDDPGAPFFNDTQKHVVSSTLAEPTWRNTAVLGAYDAEAIRRLKAGVDGDVYVSGSATLVQALLADGLVDELHLFVFPLTRGAGVAPPLRGCTTADPVPHGLRHVRQRRHPSRVCAIPSNGVKPA